MWRCKWAELKIKEFGSQAIKCDREILALNQRKHTSLHQYPAEESGSRSLPYTLQEQKQKVLKRRKRERVEDKVDTKSYMSNHNLFSYLGKIPPEPCAKFLVPYSRHCNNILCHASDLLQVIRGPIKMEL